MKKILLSTTTAFVLSASIGHAQSVAEQVAAALQAQGYESIEVTNGWFRVRVEAVRDGRKLEAVYDARTGEILDQDVEQLDDDEEDVLDDEDDDQDQDDNDQDDEDDDDDDDNDDDDDDDNDDDDD